MINLEGKTKYILNFASEPRVKIQPKREPSDLFAEDLNEDAYSAGFGIDLESPKKKR